MIALWAARGLKHPSCLPPVHALDLHPALVPALPPLADLHGILLTHALALSATEEDSK